ncbi:hypothetical protein MTR67_052809 [Solanum verrucosum]|uniref:Uncharacterized protein n=1 Tax=Solanum verrucosum TaxID=315347 RepID=A0AAF0V8L4_SOLVR|nr:hypothetical protein MTR67_052809 [Solanum verrucosum]
MSNLSALQDFLDDTTKDIETLKVVKKRIRNVVYKVGDRVDSSLRNILLAYHEDKRQKACRSFYEELLKVDNKKYSKKHTSRKLRKIRRKLNKLYPEYKQLNITKTNNEKLDQLIDNISKIEYKYIQYLKIQ